MTLRQLEPGSASELYAVVGLANTLALNFPSVRRVKILVEGEEVNTLAGHLDLTHPIWPDPSMVKPLVETDFLDTFRVH